VRLCSEVTLGVTRDKVNARRSFYCDWTDRMPAAQLTNVLEFFRFVCAKPGMFLHSTGYDAVWSFIEGFDTARDRGPLAGFREWLLLERGEWTNLPWFMLIRERSYPGSDPGRLPTFREHAVLRTELAKCLRAFETQRERVGLHAIFARYQDLMEASHSSRASRVESVRTGGIVRKTARTKLRRG
jgi:hypothetical protein